MQAVPFQLQMQMGSGGHPCGPDLRYLLPCRHQLPFGHTQLAAMGIKGLDPVPMVQLEVQAVGVIFPDIVHRPVGKGSDGIPLLPPDVHPVDGEYKFHNGVVPVAVGRAQMAQQRGHHLEFS